MSFFGQKGFRSSENACSLKFPQVQSLSKENRAKISEIYVFRYVPCKPHDNILAAPTHDTRKHKHNRLIRQTKENRPFSTMCSTADIQLESHQSLPSQLQDTLPSALIHSRDAQHSSITDYTREHQAKFVQSGYDSYFQTSSEISRIE